MSCALQAALNKIRLRFRPPLPPLAWPIQHLSTLLTLRSSDGNNILIVLTLPFFLHFANRPLFFIGCYLKKRDLLPIVLIGWPLQMTAACAVEERAINKAAAVGCDDGTILGLT